MRRQKLIYGVASLAFALLRAWSLVYYRREQAVALGAAGSAVLFLLRVLFYALLFCALFAGMQALFVKRGAARKLFDAAPPGVSSPKLYFSYCAMLFVGWLPHLVVKYPGALCWDSWQMLTQYRHHTITNFYSPYYSVLLGSFTGLFEGSGHAEVGLFLFAALHFLAFVLVFAYSLWLLRVRMRAGKGLVVAVLLCCLLCPYILGYVGVVSKDCLYSVSVFLFLLCLLDESVEDSASAGRKRTAVLLVLSVLNVCLVRRNGVYVILATGLCVFADALLKRKGLRLSAVIAFALGLAFVVSAGINRVWSVGNAGSRDAFSVCFQQTARYVCTYPDEITEEEADVIRGVLPYEELPSLYDPRIADPVKARYEPRDGAAFSSWLKLWARWFVRHPGCYFAAVMEQNQVLFLPEVRDNISLYRDVDTGYELGRTVVISRDTPFFEPIFREPEALRGLKEAAVREYMLLHQVPGADMLGNLSFWFYLLLFLAVFAAGNRLPWFLQFMPVIATVGIVFISPVIYGHPRYMFPAVYSAPALLAFVLYSAARKKA